MDDDLDLESRGNRFTNAMEAVADLVSGQQMEGHFKTEHLGSLLSMLVSEAHLLYDTKFGPCAPKSAND